MPANTKAKMAKAKTSKTTAAPPTAAPPTAAPPAAAPPAAAPPAAAPAGRKRKTELPPVQTPTVVVEPEVEPPKPKKSRAKKTTDDDTSTVISAASTAMDTTVSTTVNSKTSARRRKPKTDKRLSTRTPSSYVLFSMEERKTIMKNSPDLGLGEISKLCGKAWRELADKTKWIQEATNLKQKRLAEIAEMTKDDPPKKRRKPSSYLLFAMEHRKVVLENNKDMGIGDVSKLCGAAWKNLSDEDKQVWKDKADAIK